MNAASATTVAAWGGAVYARRLRAGSDAHCRLHLEDGAWRPLPLARWLGPVTGAEAPLLDHAHGPVLDVGCGPGRLVDALARRGVLALGIDESPDAVALARRRGAPALAQSIFGPVPSAGLGARRCCSTATSASAATPSRSWPAWPPSCARAGPCWPRSTRPGGPPGACAPGSRTTATRPRGSRGRSWASTGSRPWPAGAGLRLRSAWGAAGRFFAVLA